LASKTSNPILARIEEIHPKFFNIDFSEYEEIQEASELLQKVIQDAQSCTSCLLSETRNSVMIPDGDVNSQIMVVGESPGFLEDLTQIPLTGPLELRSSRCSVCTNSVSKCFSSKIMFSTKEYGRKAKPITCIPNFTSTSQLPEEKFYIRSSGAILDGILLEGFGTKYPRQNWINKYNLDNPKNPYLGNSIWFITNAIQCRSWDTLVNRDIAPSKSISDTCKKWLLLQWACVKPKVIICLGRVSLSCFIGSKAAAEKIPSGVCTQTKFGPVFFQQHPAYIMRESDSKVRDLGYAKILSTFSKAIEMTK
jgi:uracil-DNA glycosylase